MYNFQTIHKRVKVKAVDPVKLEKFQTIKHEMSKSYKDFFDDEDDEKNKDVSYKEKVRLIQGEKYMNLLIQR